ncbi:unnamed protein product [Symbiodinium natans]|uniref:Uncharacterized protein n=1 Tax=Symbiodinium natans TaxID=878477 RepID=A0A812HWQ4_9DINO|nr:unnamed protein product [Symbiodinium natans]
MIVSHGEEKNSASSWTISDLYQALQAEQRTSANLRCELQKAKEEIHHLRDCVHRLERSNRFVRCDGKDEEQASASTEEATAREQVPQHSTPPCTDAHSQHADGIELQGLKPNGGHVEADAVQSQEGITGKSEMDGPGTASKGSYVRAADKVYWVSYEDPLQLIRLPSAEAVGPRSSRSPDADAAMGAQAVPTLSRQPKSGEEVLLPGTPEHLPRALRPSSAERSCFSARGKLQGHGFAVMQVPTHRTIAQRQAVGGVGVVHRLLAPQVYPTQWQTQTLQSLYPFDLLSGERAQHTACMPDTVCSSGRDQVAFKAV